jgi:hypothetical protein
MLGRARSIDGVPKDSSMLFSNPRSEGKFDDWQKTSGHFTLPALHPQYTPSADVFGSTRGRGRGPVNGVLTEITVAAAGGGVQGRHGGSGSRTCRRTVEGGRGTGIRGGGVGAVSTTIYVQVHDGKRVEAIDRLEPVRWADAMIGKLSPDCPPAGLRCRRMGQPIQPPATPPSGRLRSFILTAVAATLGSGIAIAAAFGIWFWSQPNFDGLPAQVRTSMNEFISDSKQLRETGVRVTAVTVMHADGNIYEGQATATDGTADHQVMVHITYDGDTMLWQTDPGAFLFTLTHADP